LRLIPESVADKAGVAHIRAWDADSDYVVGCRDVEDGCKPQRNITETRHAVPERTIPTVTVAASVVLQHMVSDGRVVAAFGVKKERATTDSVFVLPWALRATALTPIAVLSLPTVLLKSARCPTAML